jgi:hypothetical protein
MRNAQYMARIVRFAKIGKIIRLMRLLKIFKIMKNSSKLKAHFGKSLQISQGLERLFMCFLEFLFSNHVFACLWIMIGQFEDGLYQEKWLEESGYNANFNIYMHSFYFTVTTMTTVGYGDMSAATTPERVFCIVLMVVGVIVFTFISGALASVISNYDEGSSILNE